MVIGCLIIFQILYLVRRVNHPCIEHPSNVCKKNPLLTFAWEASRMNELPHNTHLTILWAAYDPRNLSRLHSTALVRLSAYHDS